MYFFYKYVLVILLEGFFNDLLKLLLVYRVSFLDILFFVVWVVLKLNFNNVE